MPAVWVKEGFVKGGLGGITEFVGRLREVEEDCKTTYDGKSRTQMALHFYEVEIIESADPVVLENGLYTTWVGQSGKTNSTNQRMFNDWFKFHTDSNLDGELPTSLYGLRIRYRKASYDFGEKLTPGSAFIPVELVGDDEAPRPRATKVASKPAEVDEPVENEIPDEALVSAVVDAIGEDGATRDMLRKALFKTAAIRARVGAVGGLDELLAFVVESGRVEESEGFYSVSDPV